MENGITALYLRLSREDESIGESQSIGSQRQILHSYAQQHGMQNCREYIDDGWSGTDADRPAFQQLLQDVEGGKISIILVKDLSRLGRNITLTTYLLDEFFPEHRVRLCAVGDGCDTAKDDRMSRKMGSITNLMNEWYAEDLSYKIRASLEEKRKAGEYVGSIPPYGYQRDPENRHHLIPNPAAAEVVYRIYAAAAARKTLREITEELNQERIPCPLSFRKAIDTGHWMPGTLSKLLRNPVYRGALAQGRRRKVSFKSRRMLSLPPEEWTVRELCHTPLVEASLWEAAQHNPSGNKR